VKRDLPAYAVRRLCELFEDADGEGDETEFVASVTKLGYDTLATRERAATHPHAEPAAVRKELDRVASVLRGLSPDARCILSSRMFDPIDYVETLIYRATTATPSRAFDFARLALRAGAANILREHEIPLTTSRDGALIALLSILVEALELPYDARAIAREWRPVPGLDSPLG
jgi:hypothetical protein